MADQQSFSVTESNTQSTTARGGSFVPGNGAIEVTGVAQAGRSNAGVGVSVDGIYGAIVLAEDGSFQYLLDNTRSASNLLTGDMIAQERFTVTYTLNGQTRTAQLVIDVTGVNEADQVLVGSGSTILITDPYEVQDNQVVTVPIWSASPYADANDELVNRGVIYDVDTQTTDGRAETLAASVNGRAQNDGLIVAHSISENFSQAIGLSIEAWGPSFVNNGIIRAIAEGDNAQANGAGTGGPRATIVNTGVIEAISDEEAWALRPDHITTHVINSGLIYAQGNLGSDDWAYGVAAIRTGQISGYQIENSGTIQAVVGEGSQDSIGILIFSGTINIHSYGTIHNSGLIVADTAITTMEAGYYDRIRIVNDGEIQGDLRLQRNYNVVFNNSGAIWAGDLFLGTDSDIVTNGGTVSGDIDLSDGIDFYVGIGRVTGTVLGGGGGDVMQGGAYVDRLSGSAGDDIIIGGAGGDILTGGNGADIFVIRNISESSAAAADTILDFTTGADKIDLSLLNISSVSLSASGGRTTLTATTAAGQLVIQIDGAVVQSDVIFGVNASGIVNQGAHGFYGYGSAGLVMTGQSSDDFLFGTKGSDRLDGGLGADYLAGHVGDDVYFTDDLLDRVIEMAGEGNDTVYSSSEFALLLDNVENLYLTAGSEAAGNDLDNLIVANNFDNMLYGRGGADHLYGYRGDDTYYVDGLSDLVFEKAGEGVDTVVALSSYYLHQNVENATLYSTLDTFLTSYVTSIEQDYYLVGNNLDNRLTGNLGDNLLIGGLGNDVLMGDAGNDSLFGEDGADEIEGGLGIDYLVGGLGDDFLRGGSGADALYGGDGNDTLIAEREPVRDDISGSIRPLGADDFVTDILVGGAGDDLLYANSGLGDYDLMDGGSGNDSYYVDTPADLTFEAADGGVDTVYADIKGVGYYLYAHTENLVLLGDTPFGVGNDLANELTGSATVNYLLGGAGNDILNGKGGNDVLFGEAGADTFVFEHGTGGDAIGDFLRGTDKIDVSAFGFASFVALQAAFSQVGNNGAITLGNGDFVVLHGVKMSELEADDFILLASAAKTQVLGSALQPGLAHGDDALSRAVVEMRSHHDSSGLDFPFQFDGAPPHHALWL